MSRTLRRTLSWLFVLVLIVFAVMGWHHLPGSGGLVDELRWLLARDYVPTSYFNRAAALIHLAEYEQAGTRRRLFEALLSDEDQRVVHSALLLLSDGLKSTRNDDLRTVFCEWLQAHPRRTEVVDEVMSSQCGLDWRKFCESGSAASQPGTGDGGG